ncbi:hypothetical protein MCOR29_009684 [Pyricularia oryzae]|nr:hypothetical protein MCOR29_009684 [Pyricularia oryzae]KAI6449284.1 hypothetical protein MCOR22_002432 [Pyricularia oryzae]KAI6451678.1 hypothetical protein MCOR15_009191 [Pyricularia oryzae]KAI6518585.1 hypothetical protein MCOR16_008935 [Pyricularia oryzae]KAI6581888.1 hypothetical protein MCOR06_008824 [Pyricularia oryzae]
MDWPRSSDPLLNEEEIKLFGCVAAPGPALAASRYVYLSDDSSSSIRCTHLTSDRDWDRLQFPDASSNGSRHGYKSPAKFHLVMIPPQTTPSKVEKANIAMWRLPLSLQTWTRVAKRFRIHHFLDVKVLLKKQMLIWSTAEPSPSNAGEKVWMNVSMTSDNWKDNNYSPDKFAMSSAHLEAERLTTAVILGLKPSQMSLVESLVSNANAAGMVHHPLFTTYLVAELMRERLARLSQNYMETIEVVHGMLRKMYNSEKDELRFTSINTKQLRQISEARKICDKVEVEILGTKRHLEKAVRQIFPRLSAQDAGRSAGQAAVSDFLTQRYQEKFDDILTNLEDLKTTNRSSVELMSQQAAHIQTCLAQEQAQTARKEAKESARSAENSYVIAIMGMFFLPASTLATIFAMPIFKWDEHPLDLLLRSSGNATETPAAAAAGNSTATSADSSSPADVLTGYVWVYCIISIGITLLLYIYKLIREKISRNRVNGSEHPVLDLLLKPLTMIWRNKPQQRMTATDPDRKRWTGNAMSQVVNPVATPRFSLPQHMPSPVRHPTTQSLPTAMPMAPPGSAPPRRQTEVVSARTDRHRYGRDHFQAHATLVNSSSGQGHEPWVQGAPMSQTPPTTSRASSTNNLVQPSINAAQHSGSQRATPSVPSHQHAPQAHSRRNNTDPGPPPPPPPATQPHRGRQGSHTSPAATTATQPPRITLPPRSTQPDDHGPPPRRGNTTDQKAAEPKQQPASRAHTFPPQAPVVQVSGARDHQHGRYWAPAAANPRQNRFAPEDPDSLWPGPPPGSSSSSGGSRDSSRGRGAGEFRESESREGLVGAAGPPGMAGGGSGSSRSGMGLGGR